MLRKICILVFSLFCLHNNLILSQQATFEIKGLLENKCTLSFLRGETVYKTDTLTAKTPGVFYFNFNKEKNHSGFYRLTFKQNKWIDFVYDKEEISLKTNADNIYDSLTVVKSESNKLYYMFTKLNKDYKTKSELLLLMLTRYPKDDNFYEAIRNKLISLQAEYTNFVNNESQKKPEAFIAQYIKSAQLAVTDINLPMEKQLVYLKSHALDKVDFNNSDLIFSDAFTNKSIEYLMYYRNPQLPKEILEKEFSAAVDTILNKAKVNSIVYKEVTEYLVDGFKKFGFDFVIDYIVENYVIKDDICLDTKLTTSIQRRMDQSKYLKIGTTAPDISLPDSTGNIFNLSGLKKQKTLIVFYASWCPHCQAMLPQIFDIYKKNKDKGFEVVAISINTNKTDWTGFISKNGLSWINLCDMKGWSSPAANDYFLYATPTMFLIDSEKKIIAKPRQVDELTRLISN